MTDTEAKALALLNEVRSEYPNAADYTASHIALCRAIEQHEAFKQKVSDALEQAQIKDWDAHPILWCFLIPKPKPDPLVEAMKKMGWYLSERFQTDAEKFRAALDALGFEIREKGL
jgi:hypothetical protein